MDGRLVDEGLVIVLRGVPQAQLAPLAQALYDGGVRIVEVAFEPGDADTQRSTARAIEALRAQMDGRMLVGAGTCIRESYVETAYAAGAQLIVSPNTAPGVIERTKALGMLSLPGAYTPSEAVTAWEGGADAVKLFPLTMGNIGHLRSLAVPLGHIPFFCFGGCDETTVGAFFAAGASGVGTGVSIVKPELLRAKDYRAIGELARRHVEAVRAAQGQRRSSS